MSDIYITTKQDPRVHKPSWESFWFEEDPKVWVTCNRGNTRTIKCDRLPEKYCTYAQKRRIRDMLTVIKGFNIWAEPLRQRPRRELYREFKIPKRSHGLRTIDAPCPELKDALRKLKEVLETSWAKGGCGLLYHTDAFAYIQNRAAIDAVKRHQGNKSRWFAKYDVSDFFGSTTLDFTMKMLEKVYPMSEIMKLPGGAEEVRKAIELSFLDGKLPQGSPLSPTLTNIIMIPIDLALSTALRGHCGQRFVYTRYADDFLISSKYDFNYKAVGQLIEQTFQAFNAPYKLKAEKTRYGSNSGSNWNLGVMLNANNDITIGYKNKRRFRAMLSTFAQDAKNGFAWEIGDVQHLAGLKSYYHMVEGKNIDEIVTQIGQKFEVDINQLIKDALRVQP